MARRDRPADLQSDKFRSFRAELRQLWQAVELVRNRIYWNFIPEWPPDRKETPTVEPILAAIWQRVYGPSGYQRQGPRLAAANILL
ncbi:hypothetical protein T12_7362, partial [Trichinella patagoniensis]